MATNIDRIYSARAVISERHPNFTAADRHTALQASSWGAFGESPTPAAAPQPPHKEQSDDWATLLDEKPARPPPSAADPFGGVTSVPPPPPAAVFDPFALSSGPTASADPFSQATGKLPGRSVGRNSTLAQIWDDSVALLCRRGRPHRSSQSGLSHDWKAGFLD